MRYDKQNRKLDALKSKNSELQIENEKIKNKADLIEDVLISTLHEVRKFSTVLSRFSERLSREAEKHPHFSQTAQTVLYTTGMLASRLAYTDIELNPQARENQTIERAGIYKKFDKSRRILAELANSRQIKIEFIGESHEFIEALPIFELLPFVLLENAIKYSPQEQSVIVEFNSENNKITVSIKNIGPLVNENELDLLFRKGFRGSHTKNFQGEGRGLYLAKRVCDFHDINIQAKTGRGNLYQISGIEYAEFLIVLEFLK